MPISFVNQGTLASGAANPTPGLPAGISAGDLLICEIGGFAFSPATPAGWTADAFSAPFGVGNRSTWGFHRTATGSDSAPTFVMTGGGSGCARIYAFRGVDTATPIEVALSWAANSTTSIPVNAVTTLHAGAWIVYLGFISTAGGVSITGAPNGATFLGQNVDGGGNAITGAGYLATVSPGVVAAGVFAGTTLSNQAWGGAYSLKPAPPRHGSSGGSAALLYRRRRGSGT